MCHLIHFKKVNIFIPKCLDSLSAEGLSELQFYLGDSRKKKKKVLK